MDATCYNHPISKATATCADCGEPICAACTRPLRGEAYCPADYMIARVDPVDRVRPIPMLLRSAPPPAPVSASPLKVKIMPYQRTESVATSALATQQQGRATQSRISSGNVASRRASVNQAMDWFMILGAITPGLAFLAIWPFSVAGLLIVASSGLFINFISLSLSIRLNSSNATSMSIVAAMVVNTFLIIGGIAFYGLARAGL